MGTPISRLARLPRLLGSSSQKRGWGPRAVVLLLPWLLLQQLLLSVIAQMKFYRGTPGIIKTISNHVDQNCLLVLGRIYKVLQDGRDHRSQLGLLCQRKRHLWTSSSVPGHREGKFKKLRKLKGVVDGLWRWCGGGEVCVQRGRVGWTLIPGIGFSSLSLVKPDVRSGETGKNRSRSKRRLEDGEPLTIYFVLDPQGCRF